MIKLINKWRANRIYKKSRRLDSEIAALYLEQNVHREAKRLDSETAALSLKKNMHRDAAKLSLYAQWHEYQYAAIQK